MKNRSLALVPEGRLKRIYAIENAVKITGALGVNLASAIKYVRAGRGAQIPCDMCVDACLWSRDYHKAILESRADVDLITTLFLAAAEKVYVPEIDFAELQLPQIEHLRYMVRSGGGMRLARRLDNTTKWDAGVMSLVLRIPGWKIEDGVCINRRRQIFGVMVTGEQWHNPVNFAVGIVIGCKNAKVYIIVGNDGGEMWLGRIPKAFRPFIDVVTSEVFFNIVAGRKSVRKDPCSAIESVRRKCKTERKSINAYD